MENGDNLGSQTEQARRDISKSSFPVMYFFPKCSPLYVVV